MSTSDDIEKLWDNFDYDLHTVEDMISDIRKMGKSDSPPSDELIKKLFQLHRVTAKLKRLRIKDEGEDFTSAEDLPIDTTSL